MSDRKVRVEGSKVVAEFSSSATAREIGAQVQEDINRMEGGVSGKIRNAGNALRNISDAIGQGTFEGIAIVFMIVGVVIAYTSWSRLLPIKDMGWLIGLVGAGIVVGAKVSAARWAKRLNDKDDAEEAGDARRAEKQADRAGRYSTIVIGAVLLDALVAAAFAAAVSDDAETGRIDYDAAIARLEREARDLDYEAEGMPRAVESLEILQEDLDRFLQMTAYNNAGQPTSLTRGEVIKWNTDQYCLPGGEYASYVERYCPDVVDLHRKVRLKQDWANKKAEAQGKLDEAARLRAERPEASSGMALGKAFEAKGEIWTYLPPVLLMAVVLVVMVFSAFVAKRNLDGE